MELGNGVPHYQGLHPRGRGVMTVISAFLGSGPFSLRQVTCASVGSATELARYGTGSGQEVLGQIGSQT